MIMTISTADALNQVVADLKSAAELLLILSEVAHLQDLSRPLDLLSHVLEEAAGRIQKATDEQS